MARITKATKLALEASAELKADDYKTEEEALEALGALENKREKESDDNSRAALSGKEQETKQVDAPEIFELESAEHQADNEENAAQDLQSNSPVASDLDLVEKFMEATGVERESAEVYVNPAIEVVEGQAQKVAQEVAQQIAMAILTEKSEAILAEKMQKISEKLQPAVREATFAALDSLSRELGGGTHILEKFLADRTKNFQRHVTELRQPDGSSIEVDSHDGNLWHFQAPLIDFLVRMHGFKVNMFGTSGIGKTHLVSMLCKLWGAKLFFMAGSKEITTAHFFGVYDANSNFQDTPVTLWARFPDGKALLLLDEADRVLGDSFISLNSLLENDLVYNQFRVAGRPYFDDLTNPDDKFVIITSNTDMTGGSKKYTQANKQDRAAVNRYLGVQMMNDYYMQRKLAGQPVPERECVWASFSDSLEIARQMADSKQDCIEVAYNLIEKLCMFMNKEIGDPQKAKEYQTYDVTPSHAKRAVSLMRDGVPWFAVTAMTWGYGIPASIRETLLKDAGIETLDINMLTNTYDSALTTGTGPWANNKYWSWAQNV